MRLQQVFRGKISSRFRIIDGNNSGRVGLEEGQTYLLFLSFMKEDNAWAVDSCGNSGRIQESGTVLREIEKLQHVRRGEGGTIQGSVWLTQGAQVDPGATVLVRGVSVRGDRRTLRTTSNDKGKFSIHVPAGQYRVRVIHKGTVFEPAALSYEDPGKLRVADGGCAQVQFDVVPPR